MKQSRRPPVPAGRPDLNEIAVFSAVAAARSFSGAAQRLGMPVSTVSRKVAQLEARLGVALLTRTTRQVRVTEAGQAYFAECERLLAGFRVAEAVVSEAASEPRGLLRVTAPADMGSNGAFVDFVARFLARHPGVELELVLENRFVDLVTEQVDVAVRAGPLTDSSLIAKRIGRTSMRLMASPGFLERHGPIDDVAQLARLPCLRLSPRAEHGRWTLHGPRGKRVVAVRGPVIAGSINALSRLAAAGLGIAALPDFSQDPSTAGLRVVLPEWTAGESPAHIVYAARRLVPAKLTAFVDALVADVEKGLVPPFSR
jgi:DNA-binding transcriptional LysR family regulator